MGGSSHPCNTEVVVYIHLLQLRLELIYLPSYDSKLDIADYFVASGSRRGAICRTVSDIPLFRLMLAE